MDHRLESYILGTPFTKCKIYKRKGSCLQVSALSYFLEFLAHFQYLINICWIDESEDKLFNFPAYSYPFFLNYAPIALTVCTVEPVLAATLSPWLTGCITDGTRINLANYFFALEIWNWDMETSWKRGDFMKLCSVFELGNIRLAILCEFFNG